MSDRFSNFTIGLESPATRLLAVTPNDTTDLPECSRALNVAQAGAVRVTTVEGHVVTLNIAAGIPFPIRVCRVWQSGTTATGIVAMS